MPSPVGRTILFFAAMALAALIAGCASHQAGTSGQPTTASATPTPLPSLAPGGGGPHEVSSMGEIDAALASGPVFVEFGATWCYWCGQEKPVVAGLAANYSGFTFVDVDTDANGKLADSFYVSGIPQMAIIARKNPDGSYLYVDPDGKATTDRYGARIVGYRGYDELKPLLDAAIAAR